MPNCLPPSASDLKKARAIDIRTKNPEMSYAEIGERLGTSARQVKRWLSPTGLGQQREGDKRGQIAEYHSEGGTIPYPNQDEGYIGNTVEGAASRAMAIEMKRRSPSITATFVAHEVGINQGTVMRWWREAGMVKTNVIREEDAPESM